MSLVKPAPMGFLWLLSLCRVRTRRPVGVAARYGDVFMVSLVKLWPMGDLLLLGVAARYGDVFMVSLVKLWPMGDLLLLSLSRVRTRRPAQVVEVKGRGERSCRLVRWRLSGVTGHIVADGFPMATFASRGTHRFAGHAPADRFRSPPGMLTSFWCQC